MLLARLCRPPPSREAGIPPIQTAAGIVRVRVRVPLPALRLRTRFGRVRGCKPAKTARARGSLRAGPGRMLRAESESPHGLAGPLAQNPPPARGSHAVVRSPSPVLVLQFQVHEQYTVFPSASRHSAPLRERATTGNRWHCSHGVPDSFLPGTCLGSRGKLSRGSQWETGARLHLFIPPPRRSTALLHSTCTSETAPLHSTATP